MKRFGKTLLWLSTALFFICLAMISTARSVPKNIAEDLADAESKLATCLTIARSCSTSEASYNKALSRYERAAEANAPQMALLYGLAGSAPFFFLIGTILFAAGKVEDAVVEGATAKKEAGDAPA